MKPLKIHIPATPGRRFYIRTARALAKREKVPVSAWIYRLIFKEVNRNTQDRLAGIIAGPPRACPLCGSRLYRKV